LWVVMNLSILCGIVIHVICVIGVIGRDDWRVLMMVLRMLISKMYFFVIGGCDVVIREIVNCIIFVIFVGMIFRVIDMLIDLVFD
jgi:hypothetical protein